MDQKPATPIDFTQEYRELVPQILAEVESLYGKKVKKWEFNEIYYEPDGPYLSYPESNTQGHPLEYKVDITLQTDAKTNYTEGIFQLSHEVIHLLSPTGSNETNNLEEGLAVYFSKLYTEDKTKDLKIFYRPTKLTGYRYAYGLVVELLKRDENAIAKVRAVKKKFDRIKKKHFKEAGVIVDKKLIKSLLATFEGVLPVDKSQTKVLLKSGLNL